MKKLNEKQVTIIAQASAKITYKALKTMESRGNSKASEILNTFRHTLLDDLKQEVTLTILENLKEIKIDSRANNLVFLTDDVKKTVFQTVQNTMYQMEQKHYKHLWVTNRNALNSKGEEMSEEEATENVMYTKAVREYHKSLEDVEIQELISELLEILTDKQAETLQLLLQGCTIAEIARILCISHNTAKDRVLYIRKKLSKIM
ncbi:helix-turn-helix transcriptional regulator [Anaerovorax sp. IOR16]|uniref:helix-turn-helix transcriptional regulator n=1 Tax=Anaerovorax sp. IOR16 TaxID=2773458 RepID=UPI0019D064F1|nr:LuxR C-terminal-related transcriptional regulator [Anaerovorax sp. IOR16]